MTCNLFTRADSIRNVFKIIQFSTKGSNDRPSEEAAYMMFIQFLEECEDGMMV